MYGWSHLFMLYSLETSSITSSTRPYTQVHSLRHEIPKFEPRDTTIPLIKDGVEAT